MTDTLLHRQPLTRAGDLAQALPMTESEAQRHVRYAGAFPVRIPRAWLDLINVDDAGDPLLRQVLPDPAETRTDPAENSDAVGDLEALRAPGLIVKYARRALVIVTGACALHCRFCFRREFPYSDAHAGGERWREVVAKLREDESITEVILSGGDPLSLSNARLAQIFDDLEAIPHIRSIRIHSRHPIADPARIDENFCERLASSKVKIVFVIHCNHPAEIGERAATALAQLKDTGAMLLNQSVMLRGVNDSADVLAQLSERLFECGVLPYYLHQLDRVRGTAHFHVPEAESVEVITRLRSQLPGYLVPRLVREDQGRPSKTWLA